MTDSQITISPCLILRPLNRSVENQPGSLNYVNSRGTERACLSVWASSSAGQRPPSIKRLYLICHNQALNTEPVRSWTEMEISIANVKARPISNHRQQQRQRLPFHLSPASFMQWKDLSSLSERVVCRPPLRYALLLAALLLMCTPNAVSGHGPYL